MPLEELDPVSEIWGFCAMGVFSGHFPGKDAVRKLSLIVEGANDIPLSL